MRPLLLISALALLAGCGGITNKLCGSPGQPCCANFTCEGAALCNADEICEACGGEGQKCCGNGCGTGLACSGNVCVIGLTCDANCTLGEQRCTNNGIETCATGGVCPVWTTTVATCPSGTVCQANAGTADCIETCPGACTVDARVCTNDGLFVCRAAGACPSLQADVDDPEVPSCVRGLTVSAELSWESPTPFGNEIADIAGDLLSSYWLLDDLGNIVHYAQGPWEVELRPVMGKKVLKLASCNLGSLVFAVGESGTVYRRAGGTWTEENVGANTRLLDASCDSARLVAVGEDRRLYVRSGIASTGTWTSVASGATTALNAVTTLFSTSELFAAGEGGTIVRCAGSPLTCAPEASGTTASLRAIHGDPFTSTVWAAGENATFLERGAQWNRVTLPGTVTGTLVDLTSVNEGTSTEALVLAQNGKLIRYLRNQMLDIDDLPEANLRALWVADADTVLIGGLGGGLWYRGRTNTGPFLNRGGDRPLNANLRAVATVGDGRLFAVGESGARARRQNGAWSPDMLGASTSVTLEAVVVRNAGEVYAFGSNGVALVRRFGTWFPEAEGLTRESFHAAVLDDTRLWAVTESSVFEKNFRTGQWRRVGPQQSGPFLHSLAVRKDAQGRALELVASGFDCANFTIGLTDDSFTRGPGCTGGATRIISSGFSSAGDLFFGTEEGLIYRRGPNTLVYETVTGSLLESITGIVADGSSMWASATEGRLLRRVGGVWQQAAPDVTDLSFEGIVIDADGLFVVGSTGTVIRRQ